MTVNDVLEGKIIDFLEQHNHPTVFGFYNKVCGSDFSLLKLSLSEIQTDILMNDFFIQFKVKPKNYRTSNHFPEKTGVLGSLIFTLNRMQGKVTPITVRALHNAALMGVWPDYLQGKNQ
ncbi:MULTISPECIES: DUF1493 family protein [unclassified Rahnella]|jgi:hypothetical protein|uniref:DUF1493 family protein n=1 Tax=unclassified Rahnella TaxID=2635087 RepID=UPI000E659130|nr:MULTISPECIES: DUF1493 family protein [unclassified Rahnella]AYA09608.1 DUF1493 family protein [Rahnella aquatilis]MCM2444357.1 DUF1493 family protein [Rahnella sp. CG8]MQB52846.1 DUF1493 family protein [Rahnella sp. RcJ3]QEU49833.1 DUF1493 family protein [Rahnella aquatilis]